MKTHSAVVLWEKGDALFANGSYSRAHRWQFDGGVEVAASASPHVVPPPYSVPAAVDPEEAYIAALSSCHMLWFLSVAAKQGLIVERYQDDATGVLGRSSEGKIAMTEVTLRPRVRFSGDKRPSEPEHMELHHQAHELCFIASSVKTEIRFEPEDVS